MFKKSLVSLVICLGMVTAASAGLDTSTYITVDGNGSGAVSGDMSGVGEVTLSDVKGGDIWNGGDTFQYLHDSQEYSEDFVATVRVVSQTSAVDGRWGKAGIVARSSLDPLHSSAMAQIAVGNGSQFDAPSSGADHSPVPVRLGGRTQNDGNGGIEDAIFDDMGAEVQNTFLDESPLSPAPASPGAWLRLEYTAADNGFRAGVAEDIGGAPGPWSYSNIRNNIESDGDWYIGLGYSAHSDLALADGELHGVTFDNFSFQTVPEPSAMVLVMLGLCSLLGLRRR